LQCAVETQEHITARNIDLPEERRMDFRMGINAGEVILDDETIYGDCVNVAARLEKVSEPGGVVIGRSVYDQVVPYLCACRPWGACHEEHRGVRAGYPTVRLNFTRGHPRKGPTTC
jgi:class 3 adenylate cyclase